MQTSTGGRIGPNIKKEKQGSKDSRIRLVSERGMQVRTVDLVRIWTSSGQMWTKKYGRKNNQPEKSMFKQFQKKIQAR